MIISGGPGLVFWILTKINVTLDKKVSKRRLFNSHYDIGHDTESEDATGNGTESRKKNKRASLTSVKQDSLLICEISIAICLFRRQRLGATIINLLLITLVVVDTMFWLVGKVMEIF